MVLAVEVSEPPPESDATEDPDVASLAADEPAPEASDEPKASDEPEASDEPLGLEEACAPGFACAAGGAAGGAGATCATVTGRWCSAARAASCAVERSGPPARMNTVAAIESSAEREHRQPAEANVEERADQDPPSGVAHCEQNAAPRAWGVAHCGHWPPIVPLAVPPQQVLDLAELGVDALELGGLGDQHVHPDVVADGHLIEQAAELGLHESEALGEPLALSRQLGRRGRTAGASPGGPASAVAVAPLR